MIFRVMGSYLDWRQKDSKIVLYADHIQYRGDQEFYKKNLYCNCHRKYLPQDHYFRVADAAFDGEANHDVAQEPLTGNQTIRRGHESEAYIDGGGMEKDAQFPAKVHGVKRVSALYQLPYWRVSAQNQNGAMLEYIFITLCMEPRWFRAVLVSHMCSLIILHSGFNADGAYNPWY